MITVFYKQGKDIASSIVAMPDPLPDGVLWVDMNNPTPEEEGYLKEQLGVDFPSREEVWKNHVLNRLYKEEGVSYMTAALITKVDSPYPQTSAVTFILAPHFLVTMRSISPTSFQNFSARLLRYPLKFTNGPEILEGLLEEIITRVAYNSEVVVDELDALSHSIFDPNAMEKSKKNPSQVMQDVLRRLGACADLNSKINESMHSINRLLTFFRDDSGNSPEVNAGLDVLIKDGKVLSKQTGFLADKITFQLDATLGMINVEQNMIIKIFSVVTVFFLPPTLVSSIYGMNFAHMPELQWADGYPFALAMMLVCAGLPYIYFRRKGWL